MSKAQIGEKLIWTHIGDISKAASGEIRFQVDRDRSFVFQESPRTLELQINLVCTVEEHREVCERLRDILIKDFGAVRR